MTPSRQERKETITKMRKQQILDAALVVFSEKGFATASTLEIAQKAGIAQGTIFNYFQNKRELFIAVIKNLIITVPLLNLIEKLPGAEFPSIFKSILQDRLSFTEDDNMIRLFSLMGEIHRDPELKALYTGQFIQPFLSRMEGFYRSMRSSDKFRQLEPAVITRVIGGMILGFIMLKSLEGEASPLNKLPQEKVAEDMMNFVLHGVLNNKGDEKT